MPKRTRRPFEDGWQFGADARSTWRGVTRVLYAGRVEEHTNDEAEVARDVTAPATREAIELARSESVDAVRAVEAGAGYVHRIRLSLAHQPPPYKTATIFLATPYEGVGRAFAVALQDRLVMLDGVFFRGNYRIDGSRAERLEAALEPCLSASPTLEVPPIPHHSTPPYGSLRKQIDGGAGYLPGGGLGLEIEAALAVIDGDREDGRHYPAMIRRLLSRPSIAKAPAIAIVQSAADHSPRRKPAWMDALNTFLRQSA